MTGFCQKLQEYIERIDICGPDRNSYSKTDKSATFMRIKTDYMGNDQLLPAYNVQIGVADEYIAVVDVNHYRSDMDCFIPLMKHFKQTYGIPTALYGNSLNGTSGGTHTGIIPPCRLHFQS